MAYFTRSATTARRLRAQATFLHRDNVSESAGVPMADRGGIGRCCRCAGHHDPPPPPPPPPPEKSPPPGRSGAAAQPRSQSSPHPPGPAGAARVERLIG